jgi:signal transduction histidine kinase/CHASE3 domain sensor protein/CheY-like chemotaxis protein
MKKLSVESTIVLGFATALIILLLAGGEMYRSIQEYRDTSRLVAHTHLVLEAIEEVRYGINALISSQRTYIITGKELYLAENKREELRIRSVILRIKNLTADNPTQQVRSILLSQLLEDRLKLMNSNIALYRAQGFKAARDRIYNGVADNTMEELEKECDKMRGEELTLLKQRSEQAEDKASQALTVGALLVLVTLTALPLMWWRVRRTAQERQTSSSLAEESLLLKQVSDNLMREDTINKAYGDILTLINQDWFNVEDMTNAALIQFNEHVSIMAGIIYLVQKDSITPISCMGITIPDASGDIVKEAVKRNEIVTLRDIPADSMLSISTGVGSVVPSEIIAVPLSVKNEIVAIVELASLHGFKENDLRIINRIAPQLGFGIKQRMLEQDIKDRSSQLETANFELVTINEQSRCLNESLENSNEQLQTTQNEIIESNRKLESISRSKSDFLANMSHELRTPLNSVIGFSEVLQDQIFGPINEKQQEYVVNIISNGRHLLSLINDILDLSKVESGKMNLELTEFSLRETLEDSLTMLRESAQKSSIHLILDFVPQADVRISADKRKLKQILFNLLSNAVKFSPENGSVNVSAVQETDFMEITIADNGVGIKAEDIPKLFQAFTQLEAVYTKKHAGTGLGLALTRQLVELHGGRIWVKSKFGTGSRFSFTLPLLRGAANVPVIPATQNSIKGKSILLIDDDPLTLTAQLNALQISGCTTMIAHDGEEGLKLALSCTPDLIILDLMMPGISGFDVIKRLWADKAVSQIPILVLTAMDLSDADRARLSGRVWQIAEKGSLSSQELNQLVVRAVEHVKNNVFENYI